MTTRPANISWDSLGVLFQSHPWHGAGVGDEAPQMVTSYIEIVPTDVVKYELDKVTGLLRVDRPQKFSNVCPSLYGLVPQTLCGPRVAARAASAATPGTTIIGDDDPLDICVLTERAILHGNVLVDAIPIGGFRMIDGDEADDKIIAVLDGDPVYGKLTELEQCPAPLIDRLRHYFLTYKQAPDQAQAACRIAEVYGRHEAHEVIRASQEDYAEIFGGLRELIATTLSRA
ncbi:MAG: inorganic pyrophosphatase [Kofleriaceae bacterium]